ncbi:gfo/Idh/MocA family oxidoreductase [Natrarchaeobius halalkaliphilus]|uniref:Gfo/Idh/MocA family oxidoreductase n=1 Tax=Natrarchaeobius halalkaliphilus TaxID=1679091 RepID=A0A3N6LZW7_9EURY|nr:Gfo/Idh/MocA family oxidoreductase [Natrarchaeobius halalkaliphilus]RQG87784.1 gfo/Idh/MocA family oxidoreductase [Natrarchaeobius halalkaliphilus]
MRIAIIGCGTIAQVMHLPYAAELPELEVYALVDPAVDRAETLAERNGVPHHFESTEELLAQVGGELDAAIVLTPPQAHADAVIPILERDIDVLVEKPLAISPEDADRMVEAADASDSTAMVAYMKRYDPAYERAREEIEKIEEIDLITAYDVDPDHGRILDEVYDTVGGSVPDSFIEASSRKRRDDALSAIGVDDSETDGDDGLADDYDWHLEHICHDVNALRGLFGDVERIDHVDVFADGRYATAHLVYEGGNRCVLDSGLSNRKWFEEWLRVDAPDRAVTIEYSNPFIKNTPTEVSVKQGIETLSETTHTPSYDESFKCEIRHFTRAAAGEAAVETTFAEARDDVYLIADLFRVYDGVEPLGTYHTTE